MVADLHHIDCQLQAECLGCVGQSGTPLTGTGLRRDIGNALLLAIVGLRQSGVQLV